MRIIGINEVAAGERRAGDCFKKFAVLLEERFSKIIVAPEVHGVPLIGFPAGSAVDGKWSAGGMNGDDILAA